MKHFDDLNKKKYILAPRFTVIHHPVREKFGLNNNEYSVIDSIHHLSHRPNHPWCTQTRPEIGAFVGVGERTVYRAIEKGLSKGIIEAENSALRTTEKWIEEVVLYKRKTGQDVGHDR